jgi:hypothetical protein
MRSRYTPNKKKLDNLKKFLDEIESIDSEQESLDVEYSNAEYDLALNIVEVGDDDAERCVVGIEFICMTCLNADKVYKSAQFSTFNIEDGFVKFKAVCRTCRAKKVRKSILKREESDADFKFLNRFRIAQATRMRMMLKGKYNRESFYTVIGCTRDEFVSHITKNMSDGMTMENYGRGGWSIDHLIPISWARDKNEILKLSIYTNLIPRWEYENISKGNKWGEIIVDGQLVRINKEDYYKANPIV